MLLLRATSSNITPLLGENGALEAGVELILIAAEPAYQIVGDQLVKTTDTVTYRVLVPAPALRKISGDLLRLADEADAAMDTIRAEIRKDGE